MGKCIWSHIPRPKDSEEPFRALLSDSLIKFSYKICCSIYRPAIWGWSSLDLQESGVATEKSFSASLRHPQKTDPKTQTQLRPICMIFFTHSRSFISYSADDLITSSIMVGSCCFYTYGIRYFQKQSPSLLLCMNLLENPPFDDVPT